MEGVIIKTEVKEEQFDFVEEEIVQEEEEEEEAEEEGVNNVDSAGGEEEEDRRKQYHQDDRGSSQGKIFVGGVSWDTTEESFTKHFEKYGEIIDSVIMKEKHTRRPRGFGFITFSDPLVLDKVLEDEHVINGRTVEVKRTVPREDMEVKGVQKTKKIFVGGIPPSVTEDELKEYFSSYGSIAEHQIMLDHGSGRSRGFGFVTFESENVVETIINEGKTHEIGGKQVEIKKAEPKRGGGDYGTDPRDRHGGGYSGSYGYGGAAAYGYSGGSRSGGYGGRSAKGYGGYGRGYGAGAASSYDGYGGYRAGYGAPMYGNGEYGDDGYGSPGVYGGAGYYGGYGAGGAGYGAAGYGGGYGAGGYGAGGGYGTGGYGNGYGAAAGAYGGGGSGSYGSGGNKGYGGGAPAGRGRYHPYGR